MRAALGCGLVLTLLAASAATARAGNDADVLDAPRSTPGSSRIAAS